MTQATGFVQFIIDLCTVKVLTEGSAHSSTTPILKDNYSLTKKQRRVSPSDYKTSCHFEKNSEDIKRLPLLGIILQTPMPRRI